MIVYYYYYLLLLGLNYGSLFTWRGCDLKGNRHIYAYMYIILFTLELSLCFCLMLFRSRPQLFFFFFIITWCEFMFHYKGLNLEVLWVFRLIYTPRCGILKVTFTLMSRLDSIFSIEMAQPCTYYRYLTLYILIFLTIKLNGLRNRLWVSNPSIYLSKATWWMKK